MEPPYGVFSLSCFHSVSPKPSQLSLKPFVILSAASEALSVTSEAYSAAFEAPSTASEPLSAAPEALQEACGPPSCLTDPLCPRSFRSFQISLSLSLTESEDLYNALSPCFVAVMVPRFVSIFRLRHAVLIKK